MNDTLLYLGLLEHDTNRVNTREVKESITSIFNTLLNKLQSNNESLKNIEYLICGHIFSEINRQVKFQLYEPYVRPWEKYESHINDIQVLCYETFYNDLDPDFANFIFNSLWVENYAIAVKKLNSIKLSDQLLSKIIEYLEPLREYITDLEDIYPKYLTGVEYPKYCVPQSRRSTEYGAEWIFPIHFEGAPIEDHCLIDTVSTNELSQFYSNLSAGYLNRQIKFLTYDEICNLSKVGQMDVDTRRINRSEVKAIFKLLANAELIEITDSNIDELTECLFPKHTHPYDYDPDFYSELPKFKIKDDKFYHDLKYAFNFLINSYLTKYNKNIKPKFAFNKNRIAKKLSTYFQKQKLGMSVSNIETALSLKPKLVKFKRIDAGELKSILEFSLKEE